MKTATSFGALVLAMMFGSGGLAAAAPPDFEEIPLTLSGCVVAGEESGSYVLTDVVIDGTTLAPIHAFYRFNDSDDFRGHIGHRVAVTGRADLEDVDEGRLNVSVEDGKATTSIRSERRTVTLEENLWFGTEGSMKLESEVPTYKFNVDEVRPIAGSCLDRPAAPGAIAP